MASDPITLWQLNGGNNGNSDRFYFSWVLKSLQMVTAAMKLKAAAPWKKNYEKSRQNIKK